MNTFESDAEYKAYIAMETVYEWVAEEVDDYEDIIDTYVIDSPHQKIQPADGLELRIALRRMRGSEALGEDERGYAYITDGELETRFCCGNKVPQRFHKEI